MRASRWLVAVSGLVLGWNAAACPAGAQKKLPAVLDRLALEEQVDEMLRDVLVDGAALYKSGRPAACSYLYRGALTAVEAMLDHHPQLQKAVRKQLAQAKRQMSARQRARALHKAIAGVRAGIVPYRRKTLWARMGGRRNVKRIVNFFIRRCLKDPNVNLSRGGRFKLNAEQLEQLKAHFVDLASTVSGGPPSYKGRRMKIIHLGMGITDAEFDAMVAHLKFALLRYGVSAEDAQTILGFVETTRKDIVAQDIAAPAEARAGPRRHSMPAAAPPSQMAGPTVWGMIWSISSWLGSIPQGKPAGATLWERMGGEENVERIVDYFIDAAAADPKVNLSRGGRFKLDRRQLAALKRHFVDLASAVGGGPRTYTGRRMKVIHKGMRITDAEFEQMLMHLGVALRRYGVSEEDAQTILKQVAGTRKDIVEARGTRKAPGRITLWERMGGEKNVEKIVDDFLSAAVKDQRVNLSRNDKFKLDARQLAELKRHFVDLASALGGGDRKYTGRTMKVIHKGMRITDAEFDALVGHLKEALQNNGVKEADVDVILKAVAGTRKDIVEPGAADTGRAHGANNRP
jgi:hemoglobin